LLVAAGLHDAGGRHQPLQAAATRIGRLPDNDIALIATSRSIIVSWA
jgi:hypothetical protein